MWFLMQDTMTVLRNLVKFLPIKQIMIPIELINDGSTDESNKLGAIGDIQFVIKNKKY